ncbi:hypothetical protein FNV43_RR01380 [Rhamnella rubrinervis]|uniref:Uncharacterized protein n=1 Tax=Rhamnella rubrinervis TaxID=2594499 RepID=A0A8K0MS00_9ROSA|nr:hypothetical protein FNV43_RR01380 [Rhamnella rubrinervis]
MSMAKADMLGEAKNAKKESTVLARTIKLSNGSQLNAILRILGKFVVSGNNILESCLPLGEGNAWEAVILPYFYKSIAKRNSKVIDDKGLHKFGQYKMVEGYLDGAVADLAGCGVRLPNYVVDFTHTIEEVVMGIQIRWVKLPSLCFKLIRVSPHLEGIELRSLCRCGFLPKEPDGGGSLRFVLLRLRGSGDLGVWEMNSKVGKLFKDATQMKKMEENCFSHFLKMAKLSEDPSNGHVKFSNGLGHHLLRSQVHTFWKEGIGLISGLKMDPVLKRKETSSYNRINDDNFNNADKITNVMVKKAGQESFRSITRSYTEGSWCIACL